MTQHNDKEWIGEQIREVLNRHDHEWLLDQVRAALDDYARSDKPEAVLHALAACHAVNLPCPSWVIERLALAARQYIAAKSRTMDEALGLCRAAPGKRWRQEEAKFDAERALRCYDMVARHIAGNNPESIKYSQTEAFDLVAEELGGDATAAKVKRNFLRVLEYIQGKRVI